MTYWKDPEFKALQKDWYQRLKDAGFSDAETLSNGDLLLKKMSRVYCARDELEREVRECYYDILAQQVQKATFHREIDQLILSWYAEGKKIKVICEELSRRGKYRCRTSVRFIIRRYEVAWGIRTYTPKQLNQTEK